MANPPEPKTGSGSGSSTAANAPHSPIPLDPLERERMDAVARACAGIAHDLNNILIVVKGFGEVLQMGLAPGSTERDHLGKIMAGADRAAQLAGQLSIFGRHLVVTSFPVSLNILLCRAVSNLTPTVSKPVGWRFSLTPEPWVVRGDALMLEQALTALVEFLLAAAPAGGMIELTTRVFSQPEAEGASNWIQVEAALAGFTLPEEVRYRLFEPYFTTKELKKGSGLGLALLYGAMRQHHGRIEVSTDATGGTRLAASVPCHQRDPSVPPATAPKTALGAFVVVANPGRGDTVRPDLQSMGIQLMSEPVAAARGADATVKPTVLSFVEDAARDLARGVEMAAALNASGVVFVVDGPVELPATVWTRRQRFSLLAKSEYPAGLPAAIQAVAPPTRP